MKIKIHYFLIACLAISTTVHADTTASDKAQQTHQYKVELVQRTQDKVNRVKTALKRYYTTNMSTWPTNLNALSSLYDGDFNTPVGSINGNQNGLRYILSINLTNPDATLNAQLKTMAERNNGDLSGTILSFNLDPDKSFAAMESSLSRYSDPSGELNKMYTDINANSQNVDNINEITANRAQIEVGNISTANVSTGTIDSMSVTGNNNVTSDSVTNLTITNNNLRDSTVDELVVTNTNSVSNAAVINTLAGIDVNGQMIADSSGRMYTNGEDLNTRFLGIDETAYNSQKLGGVNSSLYVRKDKTNYFTTVQKFNGGVKASTVNTGSLVTTNLHLRNRLKTNTGTVGNILVGNSWFSGTKNQSHTNEREIRNLENIGSIRKIGTWRFKGNYIRGNYEVVVGGAVCLSLNARRYYRETYTDRECSMGHGGKDDRPEMSCKDVRKTRYKAFKCQ